MTKSSNYIIAYNAGAYGNFVGWSIDWLTNKVSLNQRPWSYKGTAHHNNLILYHSVDQACVSKKTGLVHPITNEADDLCLNLGKLEKYYDKVIFLYPKLENFVWNINNKFEKVFKHGWVEENYQLMSRNFNYWNSNKILNTWEKREWLSYTIHKQHYHEVRYDSIDKISSNKILKISLTDIRDNYKNTMNLICNFLNLKIIRNENNINCLMNEWLDLQVHKYKDNLINDIVSAIIKNTDYEIANKLTLIDESEIQRKLRENHKLQLKCYNLNVWPSNTTDLNKLLYKE